MRVKVQIHSMIDRRAKEWFKDIKDEKEFIDELRVKNGNLEISILPFIGEEKSLWRKA